MRLTPEQKNQNVLNRIIEINTECFPSVRASDEKLTHLFRTGEVFVSYHPHEVLGFAICERFIPESPRLVIIAMKTACQGKGLGKTLLDEVLRFYEDERCHCLTLTVNSKNARAIKVYEDAGFRYVSILKNHFLQDGDGVLMRRE